MMLVRNAGRRHQRHTSRLLATSFSQLQLPWLAPAQLRWQSSHVPATSPPPATGLARRDSTSKARQHAKEQVRHLATAAHDSVVSSGHDSAPWNVYRYQQGLSYARPEEPYSRIRPLVDPILINTSVANSENVIKVMGGVTGSVMDLLQHLHSSLRVGKVNRAEAIIHRLAEETQPNSPELMYAHSAVLEERLRLLSSQPSASQDAKDTFRDMQRWMEQEVQAAGNMPSPEMLVNMIRGAVRAHDGAKRDRVIRRYVEDSLELSEDHHEEVLYSEAYDDNEFAVLGQATADFYEAIESSDRMIETVAQEAQKALQHTDVERPNANTFIGTRPDSIDLDVLPEVRSSAMKGSGLFNIKRTLDALAELPALPADATIEAQRQRQFERQMLLEETSVKVALDAWREADEERQKMGIHSNMSNKSMGALMWSWHEALLPALQEEFQAQRQLEEQKINGSESPLNPQSSDARFAISPYLELLPLDQIAAAAILASVSTFSFGPGKLHPRDEAVNDDSSRMARFCVNIGKVIEAECSLMVAKERMKKDKSYKKFAASMAVSKLKRMALKQFRDKDAVRAAMAAKAADKSGTSKLEKVASMDWPAEVTLRLGALVTEKIIATAKIPVTKTHPRTKEKITRLQPAFTHKSVFTKGKKSSALYPHPELIKKLRSDPSPALWAKRMPMIVEPRPWTDWQEGGYLQYTNSVLRTQGDRSQMDHFKAAHSRNDTKQLMAGLNVLGKTPWLINTDVYKIQLEAWNSGEGIANFAPVDPTFDLPPAPQKDEFGEVIGGPNERKKYLTELKSIANKRTGLHSQRCFQNFQMEVARSIINDTIYFPHNMDFRGRAYPIPPYLNHMGADNVRGLMIFAKGKELGTGGLQWLKIHLANVAGYDKASLQEREQFTEDHLDDIKDSVADPLGGKRWWLRSDDAWQTLAACYELVHALNHPEGPEKFVSRLPIHQDGTCNGLQHYAALGGDPAGAAQVNLQPSDRPADIYTAVADHVKAEVEADTEKGNKIAMKLHGHITRKVVKQPVMTNVYGVTFFGAVAQVERQIEEIFPDVKKFDEVNHRMMSYYITGKIFASLGKMFEGAQAIQRWLGRCADRITMCVTFPQIEQTIDEERAFAEGQAALMGKATIADQQSEQVASAGTPTLKKKPGRPKGSTKKAITEAEKMEQSEKSFDEELEGEKKQAPLQKKSRGLFQEGMKPLFRSTVTWTTPLRLPVVQPYRTHSGKAISTNLQRFLLLQPQIWDPTLRRKQLQAFPPNFIHSLDATHMLLSALKCDEEGLTFASIHDSFWSHACDVTKLSNILRDQFIAMHGDDIIMRLREEFDTRYKDGLYLGTIKQSSEAAQKIAKWRKKTYGKTVGTQMEEMKLEYHRQKLLRSEDPERRKEGLEMITPDKIFRDVTGGSVEQAFALPNEIEQQRLGLMPENAEEFERQATYSDADEGDNTSSSIGAAVAGNGINGEDGIEEFTAEISQEEFEQADVLEDGLSASARRSGSAQNKDIESPTDKTSKATKKKGMEKKVYLWLPMEFPEVPERGEFDVRKVSNSHYFFH
ncbi:DNA/RNA polymerase [Polychaeton citri CBS 116435]|uniref:DNA-directed RNA polymerase n=1 Tax=Polychaeton citri CBS 116435 TaxID=1314669 RepID=A0A9P4Q483_9PEZI|nr:DNA/RNA polymerase [Polychaeton citri CBS 116435]